MKQWFSDIRKEVHVLGPLLPAGFGSKSQNSEEGASVDVETFLGEMLVQHGKRSVFFVKKDFFFFSFCWISNYIVFFPPSGFLWYSPLAVSFGIR